MPLKSVGGLYRGSGSRVDGAARFQELNLPMERRYALAFHSILSHELFHFATEVAVGRRSSRWVNPGSSRRAIPRRGWSSYLPEEEALADGYMLARFRSARPDMRVRGKQETLKASRGLNRRDPEGPTSSLPTGGHTSKPSQLSLGPTVPLRPHAQPVGREERVGLGFVLPHCAAHPAATVCIHLVDDLQRLPCRRVSSSTFSRITNIQESKEFQRMLGRVSLEVQRAWVQFTVRLATAITMGADFKPWRAGGKDVYSVRVNKSVRAHLGYERGRQHGRPRDGRHTDMGPG